MEFKKLKSEIKSPLRYPGGKSKALDKIIPMIPEFKEFREPFVGGGSVFIACKQRVSPDVSFKINDLNNDLYCFWKIMRDSPDELIKKVKTLRDSLTTQEQYYEQVHSKEFKTDIEKAMRFFIINRSSFSGLSDSGGFSKQAFEKRFTLSSIDRLDDLKPLMKDIQIFNEDYERLLLEDGKEVFIFLDPPYLKATKKRLYGKDGDLHLAFDHERFAENMKKCKHKWLITYDDAPKVRELFGFANIYDWELQYGMNNFRQEHAQKGKELFICNYIPSQFTNIKVKNELSRQQSKKIEIEKNKSKKISLDNYFNPVKI